MNSEQAAPCSLFFVIFIRIKPTMRSRPIALAVIMLLSSILSVAQQSGRYEIRLRGGSFTPDPNISVENIEVLNQQGKGCFVLVQFEVLPTTAVKEEMRKSGIHLLDFVPGNAYTATIDGRLDADILKKMEGACACDASA